MEASRKPAFAGIFYPLHRHVLRAAVHRFLDAQTPGAVAQPPKAIIVPHAGLEYSGSVAASAYALLPPAAEQIERVILFGPSHHVPFQGLATPSHTAFDTPLGRVPVDLRTVAGLNRLPFVDVLDEAHRWEHALEVQLPFLQELLRSFSIVPVAVGHAAPEEVAEALEICWGGNETLVVVSSDLTHYLDYQSAQRRDAATARAIESLHPEEIGHDDACGRVAIQGLLASARAHSQSVTRLDLRNSGDTAGPRSEVVGYGAWAFR